MKLSVIIPCYNCAAWIDRLLCDIAKQLVANVEVVLINDGSTDDTELVINRFMEQYPNFPIDFISTLNQGAARARSVGLERARGDYVVFCDSDDSIAANFLQSILNATDGSPDLIYYSCAVRDQLGREQHKVHHKHARILEDPSEFLIQQLKLGMWTAAVWTFAFRRRLAEQVGAVFTPRKAHEDHLFSLRLLGSASRISIIPDTLYIQNVTIGSLTNSRKSLDYVSQRYQAYLEACCDVTRLFNRAAFVQYRFWSVKSVIRLLVDNPPLWIYCLFSFSFYKAAWRERVVLASIVGSKLRRLKLIFH